MRSILSAVTALSLGTAVSAVSQKCVNPDLCYSLSIPSSTVSTGKGDIYFQISASTSYTWAALGQGSGMIGANMFIMYTSSDGTNVTVSPRYATAYAEPQYDTTAQITLLEGSGVSNGMMVANVLCSNCDSWNGGSEDFAESTGNFIYAARSGSPLNSDSPSAQISEHDIKDPFSWPLATAKGGSSGTNPFYTSSTSGGKGGKGSSGSGSGPGSASPSASASSGGGSAIPATCTPIGDSASTGSSTPTATIGGSGASAGPSGSGCPTAIPAKYSTGFPSGTPPAWVISCYGYGGPPQARRTAAPMPTFQHEKRDDGCPAGYQSTGASSIGGITSNGVSASTQQHMILAHGVLACLAFVALFPTGGILIRIANFSGLVWVHAALQMVGYLFYTVAFGLGIYLATQLNYLSKAHPIIGIALFVILFFQPILGMLHHKMYKKYSHRTLRTYFHLFHGRIAILLGMVNGGLGIQLANTASSGARIAYAVIVACVAIAYIVIVVVGEMRRRKTTTTSTSYEKTQRGHRLQNLGGSEDEVSYLHHHQSKVSSNHPLPPPPPPPSSYYGRDDSASKFRY